MQYRVDPWQSIEVVAVDEISAALLSALPPPPPPAAAAAAAAQRNLL